MCINPDCIGGWIQSIVTGEWGPCLDCNLAEYAKLQSKVVLPSWDLQFTRVPGKCNCGESLGQPHPDSPYCG